jgi:hypothetical protein
MAFHPLRVHGDAIHRTHLHTLRLIKMPHTFGAFLGRNLVDVRPHVNGVIGAFWLAYIAIDAFISDQQSHVSNLETGNKPGF